MKLIEAKDEMREIYEKYQKESQALDQPDYSHTIS